MSENNWAVRRLRWGNPAWRAERVIRETPQRLYYGKGSGEFIHRYECKHFGLSEGAATLIVAELIDKDGQIEKIMFEAHGRTKAISARCDAKIAEIKAQS